MSRLVIFDIDGTLTESVKVDDTCFVQAFQDVLGIGGINADWTQYRHQTDSGLALEICRKHLGRDPSSDEIRKVKDRFVALLKSACKDQRLRPVKGAAAFLALLQRNPDWQVAIATGSWEMAARFKLASAQLAIDSIPLASADDALDRVEILRTAKSRVEQMTGQPAFQQITYVGDQVWDIRATNELGIGFVGIAARERREQLLGQGAAFVFPDFMDQTGVMKALARVSERHSALESED